MENLKNKSISLKVIAAVICTILLFVVVIIAMPVTVITETNTAGSSIKNEVVYQVESNKIIYKTYSDSDNTVSNGEWIKNDEGWWYSYTDGPDKGKYPSYTWRKINGKWYYFNSDGYWVDNNINEVNSIKGIDVSMWNEEIDWNAVKDYGIEYAFVRVGWGKQNLDPYYKQNMTNANKAGVPVGVYFYSKAQSKEDAILDAQFVIDSMKGYKVSYPVVIDIEDASMQNLGKAKVGVIAKAFCDEIRSAGYTPMVYCNENWYKNYIDWSDLQNVERWIARYGNTYDENIKRDIWQCTSTGRVNGIAGNVDINFGYKDYSKIIMPRTEADSSYSKRNGVWRHNNDGWWYSYIRGGYPANEWEFIDGRWYWFDSKGYMVTGWKNIENTWYYFEGSGAMVRYWQNIQNTWYYFDDSGAMVRYWQNIENTWYYFDDSGAMVTGWRYIRNEWYYFSSSGAMQTGWLENGGATYYLCSSGKMAVGIQTIDCVSYNFGTNGKLQ